MLCSVRVARPKQRTLGGEADGQLREGRQLQAAGGIGAVASCLYWPGLSTPRPLLGEAPAAVGGQWCDLQSKPWPWGERFACRLLSLLTCHLSHHLEVSFLSVPRGEHRETRSSRRCARHPSFQSPEPIGCQGVFGRDVWSEAPAQRLAAAWCSEQGCALESPRPGFKSWLFH